MKLHKDGTVEGTPQEIAEYNRLMHQPFPPLHNWPPYINKQITTGTGITGSTVDRIYRSSTDREYNKQDVPEVK